MGNLAHLRVRKLLGCRWTRSKKGTPKNASLLQWRWAWEQHERRLLKEWNRLGTRPQSWWSRAQLERRAVPGKPGRKRCFTKDLGIPKFYSYDRGNAVYETERECLKREGRLLPGE